MKRYIKYINKLMIAVLIWTAILVSKSFAAKYTMARGIDFNTRIKLLIDKNYDSSTPDYSIVGFEQAHRYGEDMVDISEDGDSSVLAYIEDNIIYFVSDDDVYLNEDASYMFDKFVNIRYIDLSTLNLTRTKDTSFMFSNCRMLSNLNMDNDDVMKINAMTGMFYNCESLVNLYMHMLNTKNVSDMSSLFYHCINLKNIIIDPAIFRVNKVTNFTDAFRDCLSLKTNFLRKATDIKETDYKKYAIAGDDDEDKEGLFRDIDYDYTFNDTKSDNNKVDLTLKLTEATNSKNAVGSSNQYLVNDAKKKSVVDIATDSEFLEYYSNAKIKNGRLTLSDKLLSESVKELPDDPFADETVDNAAILLSETTFVDKLIPRRKGTSSDIRDIAPSEKVATASNGILRPDFSNMDFDENDKLIQESDVVSKADMQDAEVMESEPSVNIAFIIIGFIVVILIGIIAYYFKNKKDGNDNLAAF